MRKLLFTCCAITFATLGMQAQANVDVKKETTVKKVRVSDDEVRTVVVKDSEVEKETLVIPKEDVKEQSAVRVVKTDEDTDVVKSEAKANTNNYKMVKMEKKQQKEELEKSIEAEKKKTKKKTKAIIDQKS